MNDADFELLARDAAARVIEHGWKPQTLETDTWLRLRSLELAVDSRSSSNDNLVTIAKWYLEFIKGTDK